MTRCNNLFRSTAKFISYLMLLKKKKKKACNNRNSSRYKYRKIENNAKSNTCVTTEIKKEAIHYTLGLETTPVHLDLVFTTQVRMERAFALH